MMSIISVYVEEGKAVKIEEDPGGRVNKGTLFPKAFASFEYFHHHDSLNQSPRRLGKVDN